MNDYQYINENGSPRDYYEIVNENGELCKEIERLKNELEQQNIDYGLEIERLNNIIKKLERLVDDYAWNSYYIKCGNRYLKSEILNDIREIIELKGDSGNE